jgi:hypothetical protein
MNGMEYMEALSQRLLCMDRREVVELLRHTACSFDLDFTDEFLASLSLDRLRHIALAVKMHESPLAATA